MSGVTVELLTRLRGLGIELSIEGDQLHFNAPAGVMTPALRTEIQQCKPELLRLLRVGGYAARPSGLAMAAVPRRDTMPLSHDEQRLWFLHHALPDPAIYNVAAATRFRGPLDLERLRNALAAVMQRHEILRTGFIERDGAPVRMMASACAVPLVVEDRGATGAADAPWIERHLAVAVEQPFELSTPPLFRIVCLQLAELDHVVIFVAHHLICDEWSVPVLRHEVETGYRVGPDRISGALPALPLQYADYADWQCRCVASEAMDEHREFWGRQLQGVPTTIGLPFDRPRPKQASHRGGRCKFVFDRATVDSVEQIGRSVHATPFMTWLAVFSVFLHRISDQSDIVVGTPLARRARPEVQQLIGFFLNTLPIRTVAEAADGFREFLRKTRITVLQAFEHGDLPLDQIRKAVSDSPASGGLSLFSVMFVLRDDQPRAWTLPGTTSEELPLTTNFAKMELSLFLDRLDDRRMGATFEYSLDVFDEASMHRAAGQFECLVAAIARLPDAPIPELELVPAEQRRRMLVDFNPARESYERDATVIALFEQQVREAPRATAVVCGDVELDYAELDQRASRLAGSLRELKAGLGTRVAVLLPRSIEFVVSVLAILKVGAVYVPLDPEAPAERLRFMIEDAGARVLLTQGPPPSGLRVQGTTVFDVGQDLTLAAPAGHAHENPGASVTAIDAACVMYTSGSTGRPKGVVVPHRGIVRLVRGQTYVPFDTAQRFLLLSSPAFDAATFEIWGPLLNGSACVIFPERWPDFEQLEAVIRRQRVTCLWLTAGLFNQIIDQRISVLDTVRHVLTGGEALSVPHVRQALKLLPLVRLVNGYGPTESTTFACAYPIPPEGDWPGNSVPIGRPISHTSVYVLDGLGQPTPISVPGELYIGGDGVALEYLDRPELTAERFVPDPFSGEVGARLYRTGDRVRWLADGNLEFLGRFDDQVKIRGFRVEPGEIETVLRAHPGIAQVAVIAEAGRMAGTLDLVAYIVTTDRPLSIEELQRYLSTCLPAYMVPGHFRFIPHLPLTTTGKVDRKALPAMTAGIAAGPIDDYVGPRDPLEEVIVSVWEQVLKRERIGIHSQFLAVGGHSLLAMQVIALLRARLGVDLPLRLVFDAPTVAQMAEAIRIMCPSHQSEPARGSDALEEDFV